jgi:hypothetical protein
MKSKKTIILLLVGIICIAFTINLLKKDIWEKNEESLKEEVLELRPSVETIHLRDITPFDWDEVYSFHPYTSKEDIYKTIGYQWDAISETVNEGMNQIVFMQDGKVVCYVYGYPENNGYGISFESKGQEEYASLLTVEDDLNFEIDRSENLIYLRQ